MRLSDNLFVEKVYMRLRTCFSKTFVDSFLLFEIHLVKRLSDRNHLCYLRDSTRQ